MKITNNNELCVIAVYKEYLQTAHIPIPFINLLTLRKLQVKDAEETVWRNLNIEIYNLNQQFGKIEMMKFTN